VSVWLLLIVMSLATYRGTRLIVEDTFPPVLWARDRLAGGWRPLTDKEWVQVRSAGLAYMPWKTQAVDGVENRWVERKKWSPNWLAELVSCPWCASGWVALVVTAGTWATVGLPVPLLVWAAVWAVGALLAGQEWA
jgi:hypothetical protein